MWQLYRTVLGRDEIPAKSLLDKAPLTWRLMRLLPQLIEQPHFEPLRRFLTHDTDLRKRYQLSERLADLFDQYQVYRADWLEDWAEGRHQTRNVRGEIMPLAPANCWQAELWRALLLDVGNKAWRKAVPASTSATSNVSTTWTWLQRFAGAGHRVRYFFVACPSPRGARRSFPVQPGAALRA